jgi:outer membrane cobalamin receptor
MFHTFIKLKSSSPTRFIVWLSVRTSTIFFMTYFIPHIAFGQEIAANNAVSSEKPTQELSNMTVVGASPPGSQESAVQRRETSPNVVDTLSHEEIERFSDNDAASAARRLPGVGIIFDGGVPSQVTIRGLSPALNGLTFGGTRLPSLTGRMTPLDIFLENLYSRIEVTKANLPDMDAEALGGTVELVPLSPFDPGQSKVDLQ